MTDPADRDASPAGRRRRTHEPVSEAYVDGEFFDDRTALSARRPARPDDTTQVSARRTASVPGPRRSPASAPPSDGTDDRMDEQGAPTSLADQGAPTSLAERATTEDTILRPVRRERRTGVPAAPASPAGPRIAAPGAGRSAYMPTEAELSDRTPPRRPAAAVADRAHAPSPRSIGGRGADAAATAAARRRRSRTRVLIVAASILVVVIASAAALVMLFA